MQNPSLRSQPRTQHALIMPQSDEVSILDWLEQQNRFMERDIPIDPKLLDTDDELTAALVGADDMDYDDDDFSDDED